MSAARDGLLNERNFAAHAAWLPETAGLGRVSRSRTAVVVRSGTGSDTFNIVCRADFSGLGSGAAVLKARRIARSFSGQPFTWWVGPASKPAALPGILEAAGFEPVADELAMGVSLRKLRLPSPDPRVRPVRTRAGVTAVAGILARNWSPPDRAVIRLWKRGAAAVLKPASPVRLFLAFEGNTPAAACELFLRDGVAGIYNVSTLKRYRGRGLGIAVTAAALREAKGLGLGTAVLQASADGRGLYERLGFSATGRFVEYRLQKGISG